MKRISIAKIIAAAATVMAGVSIFCLASGASDSMLMSAGLVLAPMLAIVAYCLCGFFKALGTPFSLAKWGFLFAPFPMNLLAVVILFLVGLLSVAFIPMIPVFKRASELGC